MTCGSGSSRSCRARSVGSGTRAGSRCPTGRCCAASLRAPHRHSMGVPAEGVGLRVGHDVLAAAARLERGWRLAALARSAAGRAERGGPSRLVAGRRRFQPRAGRKRGDHTGPSSVDRARSGSKHHLITDGHGTPLAVILTGGNRNDVPQLLLLIDAIPPVRGRVGHPRHKPDPLFADRGYATTSTTTRSDNVGSCRPSPAVAPSTAQDWAPTAGSWNAPSPGSTASNASASAANAEPTSTKPSSSWPAA